MIHLRIVVPDSLSERTLDMLCAADAVSSVVHLRGAAQKPAGDVLLADVAREDASVILSALRELGVHELGTIAIEEIDTAISRAAAQAEKSAKGLPSDAVVWEEVEARTSENVELGGSFLAFMSLAMLIAAVGVMTGSTILIIGAMIVGPEFGPLAGLCVAIVERRRNLAARSLRALAVGFPVGMTFTLAATALMRWTGIAPDSIVATAHPITRFITHPDQFSVIVAAAAGIAGILSLTSTKSGALIGVLVSVTTIPAAANAGVAVAYGNWDQWRGANEQLLLNVAMIVIFGVLTLYTQRRLYIARRRRSLASDYRRAAGLPADRTTSGTIMIRR